MAQVEARSTPLQKQQSVLRNCSSALLQKRRPPLPDGRDGLTRSLMHCSRPSPYVLPLGISLAMGLKEEGRSVWLMATLGPFGPGVKRDSTRHLDERCRGVDRSDAHQCRHRRGAHGWVKVGQGPEKSGCFCDLLRWSVGRHGLLRSRCTHSRKRWGIRQSVNCPAHCLLRQSDRLLERRGHPSAWSGTMKREVRQCNATGRGSSETSLVIRGAEIRTVNQG